MSRALGYIGYAALFAALCGAAAYVTFAVLSKGLTVEVPLLEGMALKDAEEAVSRVGLTLRVDDERYDLNEPAGRVIGQDLPPGSRIKGEAEVRVVVSRGPEVRLIPSVLGSTLEAVKKLFLEKGLAIRQVIRVHSDDVPEGEIIAQRPAPEEWTGETITLVASAGAYEVIYYCPYFQGMGREDALFIASELGLQVVAKDDRPGGIVTGQRPEPGSEISEGGTVYLDIGGGG